MAVRDEERQHDAADKQRLKVLWRDALGHLPAVFIAGGLLLYGFLSLCYYRFYGSLGVDPNDVGLSYTGTLARSSGFVVAWLLALILMLPLLLPRPPPPKGSRKVRRVAVVLRAISVVVLGIALGITIGMAGSAAREVTTGLPVRELQLHIWPTPIDVVLLAIHADPAWIEPAGRPGDFPAVERLRKLNLLYLGKSDGTVVLYNADEHEAVYVSAGSIVLHVRDCRAGRAVPRHKLIYFGCANW